MYQLKLISIPTIWLLILSCSHQQPETKAKENSESLDKKEKLTIFIQPYNDLSNSSVAFVAAELKKIYSGKIIINPSIPLPKAALNNTKTRYRADSLIKFLSRNTKEGYLTIGLTGKDISTTKDNYPDWGIMGLGYCPGRSCVASTFRLKGENKQEKLFKVAIHELGHTQGLEHCPEKTCLMRDAEGKDRLNEEKEFCQRCKPVLIKAGWELH